MARLWKLASIGLTVVATALTGCATVHPGGAGTGAAVIPATATASAAPTDPSYLFAVNAEAGTIAGIDKDTGTEQLTLTMTQVSDHATQFADRPIKSAYVLSTKDLAAQWSTWFADSPPNAVLTFRTEKDAMPHSIVLTLTDPVYNQGNATLRFSATHIHREAELSPDSTEKVELPHTAAPASFTSGSLFIDNVTMDAPWTIRWADGTVWDGVSLTTVKWQCSFNAGKIKEIDFDRTGLHTKYWGGFPYQNACQERDLSPN